MKNLLEGLPGTFDLAEESISKLEDKLREIVQTEKQREERMKENEQSLRKMWDNNHCTNIGVPEREEREKGAEKYS